MFYLQTNWQLQDSIRGLLEKSPLFTQYRYPVDSNARDPSTNEPYALTASNAMCKYLLSCERDYRYSELILSTARGGTEGSEETAENALMNDGKTTEKIDLQAKTSQRLSQGVDQALDLLNKITSGDNIDKNQIETLLKQQQTSDTNLNCNRFISQKKLYSTMQHTFEAAAQEKQCYVCVAYVNELDSMVDSAAAAGGGGGGERKSATGIFVSVSIFFFAFFVMTTF